MYKTVKLFMCYFLLMVHAEHHSVSNVHYFPVSKQIDFEKYIKVRNLGRANNQNPATESFGCLQTRQAPQYEPSVSSYYPSPPATVISSSTERHEDPFQPSYHEGSIQQIGYPVERHEAPFTQYGSSVNQYGSSPNQYGSTTTQYGPPAPEDPFQLYIDNPFQQNGLSRESSNNNEALSVQYNGQYNSPAQQEGISQIYGSPFQKYEPPQKEYGLKSLPFQYGASALQRETHVQKYGPPAFQQEAHTQKLGPPSLQQDAHTQNYASLAEKQEPSFQQYSIPLVQEYGHEEPSPLYGGAVNQRESALQHGLTNFRRITKQRESPSQYGHHDNQKYRARKANYYNYNNYRYPVKKIVDHSYVLGSSGQLFNARNNGGDRNDRNGYKDDVQEPANYLFDYIQGESGSEDKHELPDELHVTGNPQGGFYILVPEGNKQSLENAARDGYMPMLKYSKKEDDEAVFAPCPNPPNCGCGGNGKGCGAKLDQSLRKLKITKREIPLKRKYRKRKYSSKKEHWPKRVPLLKRNHLKRASPLKRHRGP